MRSRVSVVIAVMALALVACGSDNKVGDDSLVNFKDQTQERLGARTTTTAAAATTVPARGGQLGVGGATTTTARAVVTTAPAPTQQAFEIDINGDNSSTTQFDPPAARVFKGTIVKWTNKDATARSVESDNGAFKSPSIPPGGTFTYTANAPGSFNYHDGTRPYAVASLEVVNR